MRVEYLMNILKENIVETSKNCDPEFEFLDISKWDGKPIHDSDILFVLSIDKAEAFLAACEKDIAPYVILSDAKVYDRLKFNLPFITVSLPFDEMWKNIRHSFHLLQRYDQIVLTSLLNEHPLTEILRRASDYWNASIYLFNDGGQRMISVEQSSRPSSIEISSLEGISFYNLFKTLTPSPFDKSSVIFSRPFSKDVIALKKLSYMDMSYWMIIEADRSVEIPILYAFKLIGNLVEQQLAKGNIRTAGVESDFSKAVSAILNQEITDPEEIGAIIAPDGTPEAPYRFQMMVIGGDNQDLGNDKLKKMLKTLSQNCPNIRFAIYSGEIIGILNYPLQAAKFYEIQLSPLSAKDYKAGSYWLRDYLTSNNLKCVLDEPNSKMSTFRTCWVLCHDTLRICLKMPEYRNRVCVKSGLAKASWILEAGYKYFYNNVAPFSPMLLCSPAYVTICKYDAQHNTNLNTVLFSYIRNNKNLEKTARECFLHRNTVKNKLELIKELTNLNLEDPTSYMNLVVSHFMIDYYVNYMGGDILSDLEHMK